MRYAKVFLFIALFFALSCTSGTQVSQKINQIVKEKKVTTLVIENAESLGVASNKKYKIKEVKFDNQFVQLKNNYLNLENVKSISLAEKELRIIF